MSQQVINIGAAPNDGTGDPERVAFDKTNENFTELYAKGAAEGLWNYNKTDTDTSTTPVSGRFKTNSGNYRDATQIAIHAITIQGIDRTSTLRALLVGDVVQCQDSTNSAAWCRYALQSLPVDHGTWFQFNVALETDGGVASGDNQEIVFVFTASSGAASGGGNVSNSGTPTSGQYGKWVTATTIQGVAPATVLSDIGALSSATAATTYAPLASPILTGDPQAPTPAVGDNDTSIATTAFVKSAVAAANQTYYYDPTSTTDVAGYKRLLLAPSPDVESTVPVSCSGTGDVLIGSFITDPGVPGAVEFPAGSAYRRLYGSVSAGVGRFHLQIYSRSAGGVETLARDEFSQNFSNTSATLIEYLATPAGASLSVTDRIVVKVYAQRVSGAATITVTFYAEGSAHASQIQTTIAVGNASVISAIPPLALSGGSLSIDLSGYQPLDADLTAIAALAGTNTIYYRSAANTWTAVNVSTGLTFTTGTLDRAALTGDVTASAGSNATTIANNVVTLAKMATMATASFLGRITAATGNVEVLTGTQATTLLNVFTSTLKGLVPLSGGGTTNFLRADGTFAAPPAGGGGITTVVTQTFTASGTYTPTASMKYCTIECVGGGGGGGGINGAANVSGITGGGGSGGYSRKTVNAATVGVSQTVTIGAAGSAGTAGGGGGNGGAGGATSIGSLCVANGGSGGSGWSATSPSGGAGGVIAGAVGDIAAGGAPGIGGISLTAGAGAAWSGGTGGSSFFGGGAATPPIGSTASTAGNAASNYGSGGSGAIFNNSATNKAGGAGSAGFVIITEYF